MIWKYISHIFNFIDPEFSHNFAIYCLRLGFYRKIKIDKLPIKLKSLIFKNPIGLAAGFDKNALIIKQTSNLGFGFSEIGTVTPIGQYGNKKPRIFRLKEDQGIINRNGFNNQGMLKIKKRLRYYKNYKSKDESFLIGINIGPNKNSTNRLNDFKLLASELGPYGDYITINVSSPNTSGLRDLQSADQLKLVINAVKEGLLKNKTNVIETPVFIKIAPDLEINILKTIIKLCVKEKIFGLIISNTTLYREPNLKSSNKKEIGGLSGEPLFKRSTEILIEANKINKKLKTNIFFVASGGVKDGRTAYIKILCGAHLIQLYTSLAFRGPLISRNILKELKVYMERDNIKNLNEIRGIAYTFEQAEMIAKNGL